MLTFFKMVYIVCSEYFFSSCKFDIPVRWCSSQQNSFRNSYYKIHKYYKTKGSYHFTL